MLHLSRKEDYSVILLNTLAQNYGGRLVPLSEIAKRYDISILFLRNLAYALRKKNIITAIEGKNGGYRLVKDPKQIMMGDILSVFSEEQLLECCPVGAGKSNCPKEAICGVGHIWRKLNKEFLDKISSMNLIEFSNYGSVANKK